MRRNDIKTVILAGGKGRRLKPYTTNFPKPLMPIGDRPILEILINQLKSNDLTDIIIATGHMEGLIRSFFGDGERHGAKIFYSKEDSPLGTAGPLSLLRNQLKDTFLLINGDILCDLDFDAVIDYHITKSNAVTVVLARRNVNVDFGVVELNLDSSFATWNEKPEISYLVSTGIYLFQPECLEEVPDGKSLNLPELIARLSSLEYKISGYEHNGYWLDIGRPSDYEKACRDFHEYSL